MVTNLARTLRDLKERNIWIVGADEQAEKTLYETRSCPSRSPGCSAPKARACGA